MFRKIRYQGSGPITSWQIDGGKVETVTDFIFLGSKITADSDCSHEIKRHLFLGRKAMTNPNSAIEIRDITLATKVHVIKAMLFPVIMYGCESWTIKKTEHQRIDTFELWCWKRFFFHYYYCYYFLLYNIVLVLPYINMHPPRVYTVVYTMGVSHPEPPSHLPPHTIPLDHSSAVAPGSMQDTVNLEKIFESPLDCMEIKPVDPEGNQP